MAVVLLVPVRVEGGALRLDESCAEATPTQATIDVGLVVDFGALRPGAPAVMCVPSAAGATGMAVLDRAYPERIRLDASGLICAIDGVPETGCGLRTPGGYRYWAYFHGSGSSWNYASIGPADRRMTAGAVEGWHYVEGAGNPSDPPPRRAPSNICPVTTPPTNPPSPGRAPVAPPGPAPSNPAAPPPPVVGGGSPNGPSGAAPDPAPTVVPASTTTVAPPGAKAEPDGAGLEVDEAVGADPVIATATDDSSGSPPSGGSEVGSDVVMLADTQRGSSERSGGAPIATVLAIAAVVVLGSAAVWRLRSRADDTL